MIAGIATTLREKLFDRPTPPRREVEFASLAPEMFPGRSHFLAFLEERHFEEQVEAAKHILLRLAYQGRFSPPNKFLYNLLDTESRLAGAAAKAPFNGRDHFVHLVNLYLLGHYVFWYHGSTHKRVREQFHHLAGNPNDRSQQEKRISACRGFLVAWREFVLFHDLGYPWEVSPGMEKWPAFLAPFGELPRYAAKDSSLFAISQLLALEWLRKEEPSVLLENDLRTYLHNSPTLQANMFNDPAENVLQNWGKSEKLPVTSDAGLWHLVCKIVPEADRFSILETSAEGRPVASTDPDLQNLFMGVRASLDEELSNPDRLARWAKSNAFPTRLRGQYQWAHFLRNYQQHFAQFTDRLFPADKEAQRSFPKFIQDFLDAFPPMESISDELQFDDYAYAMFRRLLESLDFDSFDQGESTQGESALLISYTISQSQLRGLQGELLHEIGASLLFTLEKKANAMKREGKNVTNMPLADYLREILRALGQTARLAKQVEDRLSDQIKQEMELKKRLYLYYRSLKDHVFENIKKAIPEVFPTVDISKENPTVTKPNWSAFRQNGLAAGLDSLLASRRLDGTATLEGYRPTWAPKPGHSGVAFADHGLASGLLYAQVFQVWQAALEDATSAIGQLLNLRGVVEQELNLVSPSHSAVHEVLYSIFLHNLYPSSFEGGEHKKFRTREKTEGFTYFAMLCDSLQPWDRKRLFNQATGSPPYTTYAENFNLEVVGDFIRITERGDQLRIDERQKELRTYLDSYLEHASHRVKLHLAEWR